MRPEYATGMLPFCYDGPDAGENKKGVVWHNDAGEKDETVFNPLIGTHSLKSPVFFG
jgi:hypothetical protein